jgi:hypothetical protein
MRPSSDNGTSNCFDSAKNWRSKSWDTAPPKESWEELGMTRGRVGGGRGLKRIGWVLVMLVVGVTAVAGARGDWNETVFEVTDLGLKEQIC